MKKNLFNAIIFLCLLFPWNFLWSQSDTANLSPLKKELARLTSQLSLTQPQIAEIERILSMIDKQAEKDGQSFKNNPVALIGAAKRRMLMQDNLIENLLSPQQKITFRQMKEKRIRKFEFTIWKEGLGLDEYQCLKLTAILNNTARELAGLKDRMNRLSKQRKGLMDESMRDRRRYNQIGLDDGQGREFRLSSAIDTVNQYKAKEIKKLLTKEQKKSFKKVKAVVERETEIMEKKQQEKERN